MNNTLDVENQRFKFGDSWIIAFKYDDTKFYRTGPERLKGSLKGVPQSTRAVDLIAIHKLNGLLLLEAKDCRGHRIDNRARINDKEVALEVALKVRDTIASIVGASRKPVEEFPSESLFSALESVKVVTVVLWLEDDAQKDPDSAKLQLSVLNQELKKQLAWLQAKTFVLSSRVKNRLDQLSVTNLSGVGNS
jgi:hypothetical protein